MIVVRQQHSVEIHQQLLRCMGLNKPYFGHFGMGQQAYLALENRNFSYQNPSKRRICKFIYAYIIYKFSPLINLSVRQNTLEIGYLHDTQQKRSVQVVQTVFDRHPLMNFYRLFGCPNPPYSL